MGKMGNRTEKKNGSVEFIRFFFCLAVLLCHVTKDVYGKDSGLGFFWRGQISVELFFIISGYFMSRSAYRFLMNNQGASCKGFGTTVKESKNFLLKKLAPLWFYHIVFNAFLLTYAAITKNYTPDIIFSKISSFFFLPVFGVPENSSWILGAEWYIGYMLFAMAVIYPFLIRWFQAVSKYIAPILGVCLYGYLMIRYHSVVSTDRMVRAFAGILLGTASFHGVHMLHKLIPEKRISVFSFLSFAVFSGLVFYMNTSLMTRAVEPVLVLFFWFALTVTFSERGLLSSTQILNNSFVAWLGKISLPIYMIQNITRRLVSDFGGGITQSKRLILTVGITVICGIIMYYIHFLKNRIEGSGHKKSIKILLVSLFAILLISTSVAWGLGLKNSYEQPDYKLTEANEFRIVYHESDYGKEADQTTLVVCGTPTRTLTIEELGFNHEGRNFLGWKVCRPDRKMWRIINADGVKKWKRWIGDDELPALYENGSEVKSTVEAGYSVHFYAQWAPR